MGQGIHVKFKGKDNKGQWHFGYFIRDIVDSYESTTRPMIYIPFGQDYGKHIVDENTVCQFTGLYDKNNKEIYNNDILRPVIINGTITDGLVLFFRGAFQVEQIGAEKMNEYLDLVKPEELEVIGNISDYE